MGKFIKIGQVVKNKARDDGKEAGERLVLNKEFLSNAPALIKNAYLDKNGGRSFYMFSPKGEKTPEWVLKDVCVKVEE